MARSLPLVRHREMSYPHRQMNEKVAIRFHTASGVGRCEKIEPVRPPLLKPFAVSLIFWSPHTWRRMPLWGPAGVAGSSRRCSIHVAQEEDVAMRIYDLSPFWRSTVGFEKMKPPRTAIQLVGNHNQQTEQKQAA